MASQDTNYIPQTTVITTGQMQAVNDLLWKGRNPLYVITTGTSTAYVITLPATSLYTSIAAGDAFTFKVHTANTGAATLTVVGSTTLAAKSLVGPDGTALTAGQIATGQIIEVVYDGTNFQVQNLVASGGGGGSTAADITFTQQGTGAVATNLNVREQQWISLWDYLTSAQITDATSGSPTLDLTTPINTANAAATAAKKVLFWPAGTYIATQITALAGMKWVGESAKYVTLKLKNSTNPVEGSGALVWSPSLNIDDAWIQSMTFDGNSANNTQGDTIVLKGCRTRIIDVCVNNSASNAITTNFNPASAARVDGIEGYYGQVTIDTPQKSGWVHYGPNDSSFNDIIIIDPGVKTNNSYYGMYLETGSGNGRFNNLHVWNRSTVTNVALAGVQVNSSGCNFVNCHFEGSNLPLNIAGSINTFTACDYYATRSTYCVNIAATAAGNHLTGTVWHYSGFPLYTGIVLSGTSNTIDITVSGDTFTPINFGDSGTGGNRVTITGYLNSGGSLYTGTYASNDIINIFVQGPGGGTLAQGIANSNFMAYQSSAQSLTASAWNVITCPNVVFDTNSEYNTGTSRWTCKVAGVYQFTASMFFTLTSPNIKAVSIYKNGAIYQQTTVIFYAGGQVLGVNCLVYLNGSSDYIGFYVLQGQGSTYTTLAARPDLYYFAASMVRSA